MGKRSPTLHIHVAYEPNRFASEQLVKVYAQLKPSQSRTISSGLANTPEQVRSKMKNRGKR